MVQISANEKVQRLKVIGVAPCRFLQCQKCKYCILRSSDILAEIELDGVHHYGVLSNDLESSATRLKLIHVRNFKVLKGVRLENVVQSCQEEAMTDWEVVPVLCGKCQTNTVGYYVVMAPYESVLGQILIDYKSGVTVAGRAQNHLLEKKKKMVQLLMQAQINLWRSNFLLRLAQGKLLDQDE